MAKARNGLGRGLDALLGGLPDEVETANPLMNQTQAEAGDAVVSLKLNDIDSCIQYRMVNADVAPDYCEFIIGSEAPGGYIWIFPKGNGVANVGIGVIGTEAKKRPGLAK